MFYIFELYEMLDIKKVIKATAWVNLASFVEHGITFFFTILLVRILFPEDFGLITLANLVILFAILFKNFGINQALIQRKKDVKKVADITFILQIIMSIVLFVLIFFSAPWVAQFFNNSLLGLIIKVLAFVIVIEALGVTHASLLEKELNFKKKFLPISFGTLAYNLITVFLAFAGFGVWSLVVGQIAKMFISTVLFWFVCPWKPSFSFDTKVAREMLSYGKYAFGRDFIGFFSQRIDSLFVGKVLGPISLGFYNRSYDLSQALFQRLSLTNAMFPAFSKLQDQKKVILDIFFKTTKYASIILMPVLVGLFAVSPNFVTILFGQKWIPMIPLLRVLLIYGMLNVFALMIGDLFKALGYVKLFFNLQMARLVMLVFALFFALDYGVLGVCVAITIVSLIMKTVWISFVSKILKVKIIDYMKIFYPSFLGSVIMLVCVLIVQGIIFPSVGFSNIVNLIFSVLVGILVYLGALAVLDKKLLKGIKCAIKLLYS